MELVLTKGCVAGSLTVDDIEEYEMTDEQRKETLSKIFLNIAP